MPGGGKVFLGIICKRGKIIEQHIPINRQHTMVKSMKVHPMPLIPLNNRLLTFIHISFNHPEIDIYFLCLPIQQC